MRGLFGHKKTDGNNAGKTVVNTDPNTNNKPQFNMALNFRKEENQAPQVEIMQLQPEEPLHQPQPAIFVSMGAPTLLIETSESHAFFRELGMKYNYPERKPACVICVSARWVSDGDHNVKIMSNPQPRTVHDFFGFADCLYQVEYMASGNAEAAAKIAEALTAAGIDWEFDGVRGYDFGCWSPLALIFPDASVPVLQVSLHSSQESRMHISLGEALAPLREEGYLLLCSGGITHNLLELSFGKDRPPPWAIGFDGWVEDVLMYEETKEGYVTVEDAWNGRNRKLALWNDPAGIIQGSAAAAHHTPEHFLPLLVAAGSGGSCKQLHHSWVYGSMSMASYMFGEFPPLKRSTEQDTPLDEDLTGAGSTRPQTGFTTLASIRESTAAASEQLTGNMTGNMSPDDQEMRSTAESDHQAAILGRKDSSKDMDAKAGAGSKASSRLSSAAGDRPRTSNSGSSSRPRSGASVGRPPSRELVAKAVASTYSEEQRFADQMAMLSQKESLGKGVPDGHS